MIVSHSSFFSSFSFSFIFFFLAVDRSLPHHHRSRSFFLLWGLILLLFSSSISSFSNSGHHCHHHQCPSYICRRQSLVSLTHVTSARHQRAFMSPLTTSSCSSFSSFSFSSIFHFLPISP